MKANAMLPAGACQFSTTSESEAPPEIRNNNKKGMPTPPAQLMLGQCSPDTEPQPPIRWGNGPKLLHHLLTHTQSTSNAAGGDGEAAWDPPLPHSPPTAEHHVCLPGSSRCRRWLQALCVLASTLHPASLRCSSPLPLPPQALMGLFANPAHAR